MSKEQTVCKCGYSVKDIKSFRGGPENPGFNLTLYRDNIKIALVSDDGWGGPFRVEWTSKEEKEKCIAHCATLPNVKLKCIPSLEVPMSVDLFIGGLLEKADSLAKIKNISKKKIVFVKGGKVFDCKVEPTPRNIEIVKKAHGDWVILNDLVDEEILANI